MTLAAKPNKDSKEYVPYSVWSHAIVENIKQLMDECLDRFHEDKKVSKEMLKLLSKLQKLVEDKYTES